MLALALYPSLIKSIVTEQVVKEKERKEKLQMKRERVRPCACIRSLSMCACTHTHCTLSLHDHSRIQKAKKDATMTVKKVSNKVLRRMKLRQQEKEASGEVKPAKAEKMETEE